MSTPQTDIDAEIAAAERAADKARARAAQLRAEQEHAEQAAKRARRAAADRFIRQRESAYPRDYNRPLREAREAAEAAVATGGDALAAWTAYKIQQTITEREQHANEQHWVSRASKIYENAEARFKEISGSHIHPAFVAQRNHADLADGHQAVRPDALHKHPELEKANNDLNELAEELGSNYRRDPGSVIAMNFRFLNIDRPRPRFTAGDPDRMDKRTFLEAYGEALERARKAAVTEWSNARDAALDEYAADADINPDDIDD